MRCLALRIVISWMPQYQPFWKKFNISCQKFQDFRCLSDKQKIPRSPYGHFLPQDVAFSIHLSDNRFTARPLATTVVSPPRKWAPWVDISTPQSASARFFAKCPIPAYALYIPSLNNWQLTDVDWSAVKWLRRTVVDPLLKIYWYSVARCKWKQDSVGVRRILVVPRDSGGASTGFCWCILSDKRSRY